MHLQPCMSLVVMASLAAGSHIQVLIRILLLMVVVMDVFIIYYYHDDNGDLMKLILMLNPQYLGPLGYSSLGYTSYRTVRSQNEKQEHTIYNCSVYILYTPRHQPYHFNHHHHHHHLCRCALSHFSSPPFP